MLQNVSFFSFPSCSAKGNPHSSSKAAPCSRKRRQQPNVLCSLVPRSSWGVHVCFVLRVINAEEFYRADECSVNGISVNLFFRKEGCGFPQTGSWASSQWGTKNKKIVQVQTQPNCKWLWMGLPGKSWSRNDGKVLIAFFKEACPILTVQKSTWAGGRKDW